MIKHFFSLRLGLICVCVFHALPKSVPCQPKMFVLEFPWVSCGLTMAHLNSKILSKKAYFVFWKFSIYSARPVNFSLDVSWGLSNIQVNSRNLLLKELFNFVFIFHPEFFCSIIWPLWKFFDCILSFVLFHHLLDLFFFKYRIRIVFHLPPLRLSNFFFHFGSCFARLFFIHCQFPLNVNQNCSSLSSHRSHAGSPWPI